jgi:hypothetical protein
MTRKGRNMKRWPNIQKASSATAVVLAAFVFGCSNTETEVKQDSETLTTSQGEHGGDTGDGEKGEESGTELALDETYDNTRNGARLVLTYDAETNSFNGTVENTTEETLKRVRVEVHLSNGKELGPTTPDDLGAGEKRDVKLTATSKDFDGWSAHPEVGSSEHGHGGEEGGEGRGEHDRDGSEHGGESGGEHK